jgi:hypothetical protein
MKAISRSIRTILHVFVLALLLTSALSAQAQSPVRIIFLHHSCGHNLIEQGDVRQGLSARGYEFYDHGYNGEGLRLADGSYTGTHFDVPGDNTNPDGLAEIFSQPLHDPPDNTFSHLMAYDVIAFKSCFPVSNIESDRQLRRYQSHYTSIRDRMDQYPEKLFIIVTQPPQVPGASNPRQARRARELAQWLQSDDFLAGHPNIVVFDFFGQLAGDDNFLRPEYRIDDYDAHPNAQANAEIGPRFVEFIDAAIQSYGVTGTPPSEGEPTPPPAEGEPTQPPAPPPAAGLVDDFESGIDPWSADRDDIGSTVDCTLDDQVAHGGSASLRMIYRIASGGWGGCARAFEAPQNLGGTGLSVWVRSDAAGQPVALMAFAGDSDAPSPFEAVFETPEASVEGWTRVDVPWSAFAQAEWAAADDLTTVDPTRVTGYSFGLGIDEAHREGTVWVDDVAVMGGDQEPPAESGTPEAEVPPAVEESPAGGLCPAAFALPLGALVLALGRKRRTGAGS